METRNSRSSARFSATACAARGRSTDASPSTWRRSAARPSRKTPARRYQSAAELAEDLRRYTSGRVIRARRPGPLRRFVKLVRRHKAVAALICLVAAVSTAAGAIGWKHYTTRWAQQYAMAEIDSLMGQKEYFAALGLAERAERYIPNDPLLIDRWPRLSREYSVMTTPPGSQDLHPRVFPHHRRLEVSRAGPASPRPNPLRNLSLESRAARVRDRGNRPVERSAVAPRGPRWSRTEAGEFHPAPDAAVVRGTWSGSRLRTSTRRACTTASD